MKQAEYVKSIGLESEDEMVSISTFSKATLWRWWNTRPERFKCVARGCLAIKNESTTSELTEIKRGLNELKELIVKR